MHSSGRFVDIEVHVAAAQLDQFTVVDVRQPEELLGELGRIAGAHNVPLGHVIEGGALPQAVRHDAPILIVCRSGNRSAKAAAILASRGFSNLYNLAGGMLAWSARGLPTSG